VLIGKSRPVRIIRGLLATAVVVALALVGLVIAQVLGTSSPEPQSPQPIVMSTDDEHSSTDGQRRGPRDKANDEDGPDRAAGRGGGDDDDDDDGGDTLTHGNVRLDLRQRQAFVGKKQVELSAREFRLAEVFLSNANQVLSREQLLSHVWGYDFDPGSNVVDVYVGYLRKKFGADVITSVRGMGYRLKS